MLRGGRAMGVATVATVATAAVVVGTVVAAVVAVIVVDLDQAMQRVTVWKILTS